MASHTRGGARLLVLASAGHKPSDEELRRLISQDLRPDAILAEDSLAATSLDERSLTDLSGPLGRVLRALPIPLALAIQAWRRRDVDVVLSWGEQQAFALALLLALTPRRRMAHMAILMRPGYTGASSGLKLWVRRVVFPLLARRGMDRMMVPAPRQRALLISRWGIAPERFIPVDWPVDTRFWRPIEGPRDTICSVGREMRDYGTLIAALQGLDIPCHIAAGASQLNPATGLDPDASNVEEGASLPRGVTVGPCSSVELRELYRRSRLVVVPVLPSDSDNGVTTIHEAMAMGRAVVSTAIAGRTEILEDGANCLLVPARDPIALRTAIERLWNDPELCARLGAAGRERVEAECSVAVWTAAIRAAADDAAASRRRR